MHLEPDRSPEIQHATGGQGADPRYHEFFDCFNRGQYFEAHEVLEALWLPCRGSAAADFFKALIQIAGAFVHFQKRRDEPARALLRLARGYLTRYLPVYGGLDTAGLIREIDRWLEKSQAEAVGHSCWSEWPRLKPPRKEA